MDSAALKDSDSFGLLLGDPDIVEFPKGETPELGAFLTTKAPQTLKMM